MIGIRWIHCLAEDFKINNRFVKYELFPNPMRKYAYLRACCHVLDKGLEVKDWEPGHGNSLYESAIQTREKIKGIFREDDAFKWVNMVINEYEDAQTNKYVKRTNDINIQQDKILNNDVDAFERIITRRTSCRNFLKKDVSKEILDKLVKAAIAAPVGCCRQTVRFFVIKNPLIIEDISKHVSGMTCFSNIQCIVMVYSFSAAYNIEDRRMQYIDASLAIENFVLAATAYNLGTTICNFSSAKAKDEKHVAQLLKIDNTLSPVVAIALGYPVSIPRKPERMNLAHFVKYL